MVLYTIIVVVIKANVVVEVNAVVPQPRYRRNSSFLPDASRYGSYGLVSG